VSPEQERVADVAAPRSLLETPGLETGDTGDCPECLDSGFCAGYLKTYPVVRSTAESLYRDGVSNLPKGECLGHLRPGFRFHPGRADLAGSEPFYQPISAPQPLHTTCACPTAFLHAQHGVDSPCHQDTDVGESWRRSSARCWCCRGPFCRTQLSAYADDCARLIGAQILNLVPFGTVPLFPSFFLTMCAERLCVLLPVQM
jgi:hypothetical protein